MLETFWLLLHVCEWLPVHGGALAGSGAPILAAGVSRSMVQMTKLTPRARTVLPRYVGAACWCMWAALGPGVRGCVCLVLPRGLWLGSSGAWGHSQTLWAVYSFALLSARGFHCAAAVCPGRGGVPAGSGAGPGDCSAHLGVTFDSAQRTIPEPECSQCPNTFPIYVSKYILYSRDYAFV